MILKTTEGDRSVTGKTQGDLNTVLGAIGTLGTLMGGGSILGGNGGILGRNGYYNNADPDSRVITKAEANLMQENSGLKSQLALKESEGYTDKKLVEVTTYLDTKLRRLEDKVDANKDMQQGVNAQQMAYNAAANASIDVLKSQIAGLMGVTKIYIPSSNVCKKGCSCDCDQ